MKTQLTLPFPASYPGSLNIHVLGICITLMTACSVLKEKSFYETDSLQRQEVRTEIKSESTVTSQALRIYSNSDSADRQSYAEIYPSGPFTYSAKDEFSGVASRLLLKERLQWRRSQRGALQVSGKTKVNSTVKELEKSMTKTGQKRKESKPLNLSMLYMAGCALIFALIWLNRGRLQA